MRRAARDFDSFYLERRLAWPAETGPSSKILVLNFDGKGVPMRPADLRPATSGRSPAAAQTDDAADQKSRHLPSTQWSRTQMIRKTEAQFSVAKLKAALETLLTVTSWHKCQIALTRAAEAPAGFDPFHHGTGDWLDPTTGVMIHPESHFRYFDERLKGTYFEEVYHGIAASIPEKIARMRIMQLPPQVCYPYHADEEYRYHLAITTNPTAFVIFEDLPPQHIPADGALYGFEARKRHTAINCGSRPRIHMVVTTYE